MAKRHFQGKDVDMLTACSIIVNNAIARQDFLAGKRSTWTRPFFDNINTRIDNAFRNFLGFDSPSVRQKPTPVIAGIQARAIADLTEVKIQIGEDFKFDKARRDEILANLGYTACYKKARSKTQAPLVQLLSCFKRNLTPLLADEMVLRGASRVTLDRIVSYADLLSAAHITPDLFKDGRRIITAEALAEFNAIYDEVISIARIARNLYKGHPAGQEDFSYSRIRAKINSAAQAENSTQSGALCESPSLG
jgi:hypothetical protein